MDRENFLDLLAQTTTFTKNPYHPLVWITGKPKIGKNVFIGGLTTINAKGAKVSIGDHCDIASFVSINCADSHKRCIGVQKNIDRNDIIIEHHVFIGTHAIIKAGAHIGHHSVIGAATVVDAGKKIPPYSLVVGNPMRVKIGYYKKIYPRII